VLVGSPAWRPAAALVGLKLTISALVLNAGFIAVSDDDFARVVIAQRFAESPVLDPSGTSWLPLPFWVFGAVLRAAGPTLEVARATALALGALSIVLVWRAALVLGWSARAAFLSAALAAVFPYSAYLGAATVPELPAAAAALFGAASLVSNGKTRLLGAFALAAACASRYEAWAIAAIFSGLTLWEALRTRSAVLTVAGIVAVGFPALWILHGWYVHQAPFFFVTRVTEYRAALGLEPMSSYAALAKAPISLVTREPELALASAAAAAWVIRRGQGAIRRGTGRALLAIGGSLGLAVVGDLRGSAPTHHEERALLVLWLTATLFIALALDRGLSEEAKRSRPLLVLAGGVALVGGLIVRAVLPREPFTDRADEVAIGAAARATAVDRLLIDTPDYGFFAVQAAFARPSRTQVLEDPDPRRKSRAAPVPDRSIAIRRQREAGFRWLAIPDTRADCCLHLGTLRAEAGTWLLLELPLN